jgi:hypothetical protein
VSTAGREECKGGKGGGADPRITDAATVQKQVVRATLFFDTPKHRAVHRQTMCVCVCVCARARSCAHVCVVYVMCVWGGSRIFFWVVPEIQKDE